MAPPKGAKRPKPASPEQILRNGHIAQALRQFMAAERIDIPELNQRLGNQRSNPVVYHWLASKGAPAPATAERLAAMTGRPVADFTPRELPGGGGSRDHPASGGALVPGPLAEGARPVRVGEVLQFTVLSDGMARIRLDVTLPLGSAMPLVRLLLDAEAVQRVAGEEEP